MESARLATYLLAIFAVFW